MTLKKQWATVKDNWLLIALFIVLIAALSTGGLFRTASLSFSGGSGYASEEYARSASADMAYMPPYYGDDGFAPGETERKRTVNAYLSTEIERGDFAAAEQQLKAVLASGDTVLLSENVQVLDADRKPYRRGEYRVKIATSDYARVIEQLKALGEVQSFSENTDDITGQYVDLEDRLATERSRLTRYQAMYAEAERVEDKINLNDRIFNQEMQIKYLEEQLATMDQRVEYSTLTVTLLEERSAYANIALAKLSELVRAFVGSINNLLVLVVSVLPWALLAGIGWLVYRRAQRRK